MSSPEINKPIVQGGVPTWDERNQYYKVQRWFRFLTAVVVISWLLLIGWILFVAPISDAAALALAPDTSLTLIFAPLLIVGLLVERVLETCFNIIEGSWQTMVAYLGRGMRWLHNAESEVLGARQWMTEVSDYYNYQMNAVESDTTKSLINLTEELKPKISAVIELRELAELRLVKAEENLSTLVTFDSYKSAKAAATIIIGFIVGLTLAGLGQLQMFALLGIGAVPARIDVLITGLMLGASTQPIHTVLTHLGSLVDRIGAKL
jgi:hypothetical protein